MEPIRINLDLGIFPREVIVVLDPTKEFLSKSRIRSRSGHSIDSLDSLECDAKTEQIKVIRHLGELIQLQSNKLSYDVITRECVHASINILNDCTIEVDQDHGKILAYMVGYLVSRIIGWLRDLELEVEYY